MRPLGKIEAKSSQRFDDCMLRCSDGCMIRRAL
uniref:Uncharacterized protein n=1 Tax=Arundo donax TaxID=35708 RepID=A0A0A9CS70_ARUDO